MPSPLAGLPFAVLLLVIAMLPLGPRKLAAWWEPPTNKLLVSIAFSLITLAYYFFRSTGYIDHGHVISSGWPTLRHVLGTSLLDDYIPFVVLLLALYTIAGGIRVAGDIPAHPLTNTALLALGAILANVIGTIGASILLIRPMLQINSERHRTKHTFIFFIFIVSNIAGSLTPVGPPLFLGYLRGVPFGWTLFNLWQVTLPMVLVLLVIYFIWDALEYSRETKKDIDREEKAIVPITFHGMHNLFFLVIAIFVVATVIPGGAWLGTNWRPMPFFRESILLIVTIMAYVTTDKEIRKAQQFSFHAFAEVASLFLGIFIAMSAMIEWLNNSAFSIDRPWQYFWTAGGLSSVLDNAPTYVVFFELAKHSTAMIGPTSGTVLVLPNGEVVSTKLLIALSGGSVFMGAMTYIGNAPNFLIKHIAEKAGIKMPGFFEYLLYSIGILVPLFVILSLVFFR
ncbi:MAG TPA: sodium:proton antiporter [Tepidisphaeraceae bacterium]|jgi:Na+/H+ antiporter NhaD/arsenite permease-like protein|nr:sodium:proton antiporter [Tepidisphaeraceae bacterium]